MVDNNKNDLTSLSSQVYSGFCCNSTLRRGLEIAVIMIVVFTIQYCLRGYDRDLANHSDEPAHFVTGVMVYDYLSTVPGSSPIAFAEDYYLRYPKVAIGHWPPGYYALQAVWYLCAGVSKFSAVVFSGLITSAFVYCLYLWVYRRHGLLLAALSVIVLIGQPLIRTHSILIMSDMVMCLFSLLAVRSFSDFIDNQQWRHATGFGMWAVLAIFTKPLALSLAPFIVLSPVVSRRIYVLRNRKLLIVCAFIMALTAPYYFWTWNQGLGLHSQPDVKHLITSAVRVDRNYRGTDNLFVAMSGWITVIALVGCIPLIRRAGHVELPRLGAFDVSTAFAWCTATLGFLYVAPIGSESRYFIPVLTGAIFLYAEGLCHVLHYFHRWRAAGWVVVAGFAAMAVLKAPGNDPSTLTGYAAAAGNFAGTGSDQVILVSSNENGEGAFIAERLLRDRRRSGFVLRASKVLSQSTWGGGRYSARFSTHDQLRQFLNSVPVHFVVIDDFGYRNKAKPPHHELLEELIVESPEEFLLVKAFPIKYKGRRHPNAIRIYENQASRGQLPVRFQMDMKYSLGRDLEFRSHNGGRVH